MSSRPQGSDALVALGCLVASLALLVALPALGSSAATGDRRWWAASGVALAQAITLAWHTRLPTVMSLVVTALPVPLALAAPGEAVSATTVATLAAGYLAGTRLPRTRLRPVVIGMIALVALSTAINLLHSGQTGGTGAVLAGLSQGLIVIGVPLLIALVVVGRRETRAAHAREIAALTSAQEARTAEAIARERTALARDLHDVAAHHMSGIAMAASAVQRQVDTDPAAARASAADIRAQSTSVLADLRRMVGVLRDDSSAPTEDRSLLSVPTLVDARPGATLRTVGTTDDVGPLAQLVGYRMVQESLANAALHAPGAACEVVLDGQDPDRVVLEVRNGASVAVGSEDRRSADAERSGFGLVGMRERAELVGGELHYGPTADGGWLVRLMLPRDGKERTS